MLTQVQCSKARPMRNMALDDVPFPSPSNHISNLQAEDGLTTLKQENPLGIWKFVRSILISGGCSRNYHVMVVVLQCHHVGGPGC